MSAFEIVNWGEVILWPAIGVGCLVYGLKKGSGADRILWILAPTFVLFGISDFIELRTGAWWKPLGLLVLKAACISVFVIAAFQRYRKSLKSEASEGAPESPDGGLEAQTVEKTIGANAADQEPARHELAGE
jgi:hypothetical protein